MFFVEIYTHVKRSYFFQILVLQSLINVLFLLLKKRGHPVTVNLNLYLNLSDQKPGGLSTLKRGNRYIYYLITKEKYWHKPTYETLESSLSALCKHCADNGVRAVSMPRIGCGLDGLTWPRVSEIIKKVFTDSDVKITVYTL